MADLTRFRTHLDQARADRHTIGIKGDYYLDPVTNRITFVLSTPPKEGRRAVSKRKTAKMDVGQQPGISPEVEPRIRLDPGGREAEEEKEEETRDDPETPVRRHE